MPSVKLSPSTRIRGRVLKSGTCRIFSSRKPRLLVANGYDSLPQCRSQLQLGSSAWWRTASRMKQVLCGPVGVLERRTQAVQSQSRARKRNRQMPSETRSKPNLLGGCRRGGPGTDSVSVTSLAVAPNTLPFQSPLCCLAAVSLQMNQSGDEVALACAMLPKFQYLPTDKPNLTPQ